MPKEGKKPGRLSFPGSFTEKGLRSGPPGRREEDARSLREPHRRSQPLPGRKGSPESGALPEELVAGNLSALGRQQRRHLPALGLQVSQIDHQKVPRPPGTLGDVPAGLPPGLRHLAQQLRRAGQQVSKGGGTRGEPGVPALFFQAPQQPHRAVERAGFSPLSSPQGRRSHGSL